MSENSNKKNKILKIFNILANVLLYTFFAVSLVLLSMSIISKKDSDGTVNIIGLQSRVVISESMEKHEETYDQIKGYRIKDLPIKSMVFIKTVPSDEAKAKEFYDDIQVGDVLTFKYVYDTRQETITHRVIEKEKNKNNDGYTLTLQGDNKGTKSQAGKQYIDTSATESLNYVVGKVVAKSYIIGLLVTALKSPVGIVLMVILPCSIMIIIEVIKIVNYFNSIKKEKHQQEVDKQKDEIEELKRKLDELTKNNNSSNDQPSE